MASLNDKLLKDIMDINEVPETDLDDIKLFFTHYKDNYNKKTKVFKWLACSKAHLEITKSIRRYKKIKNVL
ncbi:inorganic diphosphatase [Candidatus Woesearchaeota archaeon]|nr:inorganic diphosphatase [Candidatus Woesearchaeota archaeon]